VFGGRFGVTIETRYHDILQAACDVFARRGFHQASIREIARAADLSLAGLYHYVRGKDELLFLVLDRALDVLIDSLDAALARARTPEDKLLALIQTHLDFAFQHGSELKLINRDYELLPEPRRSDIVTRRAEYLQRGLAVLRQLDPHGRSGDELLSATILLLGMLNGVATRPFIRSRDDARSLAGQVGGLFLYGFFERATDTTEMAGETSSTNGPPLGSIVARTEIAGGHDDA
jgi:TetR/AcrR family transcriptional regulator, cholesterol catabolism regulator